MSVYIVPNQGDFEALQSIIKRAGIPFASASTVREFIIHTHAVEHIVCAVDELELRLQNKFARSLMGDAPTAVMSVPGLVYTSEWVANVINYPQMDWLELERKLSKSGTTAYNAADIESRGTGSQMSKTLNNRTTMLRSLSSEVDQAADIVDADNVE